MVKKEFSVEIVNLDETSSINNKIKYDNLTKLAKQYRELQDLNIDGLEINTISRFHMGRLVFLKDLESLLKTTPINHPLYNGFEGVFECRLNDVKHNVCFDIAPKENLKVENVLKVSSAELVKTLNNLALDGRRILYYHLIKLIQLNGSLFGIAPIRGQNIRINNYPLPKKGEYLILVGHFVIQVK